MVARCCNCGDSAPLYLKSKDYNRQTSSEEFDYYRCQTCGFIFLTPIPNNLGSYYASDYHAVPQSLKQLDEYAVNETFKLEMVLNYVKSGRLLEVGPSFGAFSYLAKKSGFDVEAIELNAHCCSFLNDIVGIKARHVDDETTALMDMGPYEVITLWHVLEHLQDPWSFLNVAVEKLTEGGALVLSLPNPDAFQFRVFGRFWTHLDAPRHVQLIPSGLLRHFLESRGMTVLFQTETDRGGVGWNAFGWEVSLQNLLGFKTRGNRRSLLARILCRLFAFFEQRSGNGSTYTMIFKKEAP